MGSRIYFTYTYTRTRERVQRSFVVIRKGCWADVNIEHICVARQIFFYEFVKPAWEQTKIALMRTIEQYFCWSNTNTVHVIPLCLQYSHSKHIIVIRLKCSRFSPFVRPRSSARTIFCWRIVAVILYVWVFIVVFWNSWCSSDSETVVTNVVCWQK